MNPNDLQELIFILEFKLGFTEETAWNTPWWIVNKRYEQFVKYQKEKEKAYKKEFKNIN